MARGTFVLRDGELVPKHLAAPLGPRGPRSHLSRPMVISDGCEFRSMADGKIYTSKAAYRADLRARGLDEVGNDTSYLSGASRSDDEPERDLSREAQLWDQHVGQP